MFIRSNNTSMRGMDTRTVSSLSQSMKCAH